MHDKSHVQAAVILCGLVALVLHHYEIEIVNIIVIFSIFMIVTMYGNMKQWNPFIGKVPKIGELSTHPVIGPLMLCIVLTIIVGAVIIFLMMFWVPLVEPMIDSMKDVMEQLATGNIETATMYGFLYVFVVVVAAQEFRIIRYWLLGRRR